MGKMIFYDYLSGRYFEYSEEEINKVIADLHYIKNSIFTINWIRRIRGLPELEIKDIYDFGNLDEVKSYIDEVKRENEVDVYINYFCGEPAEIILFKKES